MTTGEKAMLGMLPKASDLKYTIALGKKYEEEPTPVKI